MSRVVNWAQCKFSNRVSDILAIDIGTASISAAVAEKDQSDKLLVRNVFRYPYDTRSKEVSKILVRNLDHAFADASGFCFNAPKVFFAFSSPLYLEKTANAEFTRTNPEILISEQELKRSVEAVKNQVEEEGIQAVSYEILETKINGYFAKDPLGYSGDTLFLKANFLVVSPVLMRSIENLKDKYFPVSEFKFFSDYSVLKRAIRRFFSRENEFAVLDIGGEVSVFENYAIPFGLRKIERKIPLSFLRALSSGHLDYPRERFVDGVIKSCAEGLPDIIKEQRFNKIFLTGGGANFPQFTEVVEENSNADVKTVRAEDFDRFFSKISPLSGGEDAVLTSLIALYAR